MNRGAWHGDDSLKSGTVERMRYHRKVDALVQGYYRVRDHQAFLGYRGCAIGCALEITGTYRPVNWHREIEAQLGIPAGVATLIDCTYEHLPFPDYVNFAVDVLEAIPVGADLRLVYEDWLAQDDGSTQWLLNAVRRAPILAVAGAA